MTTKPTDADATTTGASCVLSGEPTARSAKSIRVALGLPRIMVAVIAGVSEPTVRSFELDEEGGVTAVTQAKLRPVYQELGEQLLALGARR